MIMDEYVTAIILLVISLLPFISYIGLLIFYGASLWFNYTKMNKPRIPVGFSSSPSCPNGRSRAGSHSGPHQKSTRESNLPSLDGDARSVSVEIAHSDASSTSSGVSADRELDPHAVSISMPYYTTNTNHPNQQSHSYHPLHINGPVPMPNGGTHTSNEHPLNSLTPSLPGISIIKPLMGVDPLLETNLESHFLLRYDRIEILCCVENEEDPAVPLVHRLMERYPHIDCRLFMGGKEGIVNPMVSNMAPAYEAAKYEICWISSARVKVTQDMLLDMISGLQDPQVALVHQMPFTSDRSGFAAAVEKIYFGTSVARNYLAINALGISCLTGMSYCVKKRDLDECGGLPAYGKWLAEDFHLAKNLHERGFNHEVCSVPAQQNVASTTVATHKDRLVRWARLRINLLPFFVTFLLEPLSESLLLGLYTSWSLWFLFDLTPAIFLPIHFAFLCFLDYIQLRLIQRGPLPFGLLTYLFAWSLQQVIMGIVFFEAAFKFRYIRWGSKVFRLYSGGLASLEHDRTQSVRARLPKPALS